MSHLVFVESTRVGLRALEVARRLGHRVTFITSHQADWLLNDADRADRARHSDALLEVSDTRDPAVLQRALHEAAQGMPVDAALSTLHQYVEPTAIAAAGMGITATSVAGIHNARDKARCRDILRERGLPSARYAVVRTVEDALAALAVIGYPVVVKPTTGVGKVLTAIIEDEAQLRAHFASAEMARAALRAGVKEEVTPDFILEELLRGPLYSVELGVSAHGEHVPFAILKRKLGKHNRVLELGSTLPTDLSAQEHARAAAYASEVVRALGLDLGVFHVEIIYTADGPRLVEVNPRICGAMLPELIRIATGGDLFEYLIRIHLRERLAERLPLDGLPCTQTISTINIAAYDGCTVRPDLPDEWAAPFRDSIVGNSMKVTAGQELRRMEGNYDNYGVLWAVAADYATAVQRAEDLRLAVERQLGVKLVEGVD